MISAADSAIAGYLVQYGETETARWVLTCSEDDLLRIGSVGHWLELRGPSTPTGAGMMLAKALALAAVYVREGKPRDLVRSRRRLTGDESVVAPEHRERRPSVKASLTLPRDYGIGDDARDYWEEQPVQSAPPSGEVPVVPKLEPTAPAVSDAIMRWWDGRTKYNLTENLIRNDVGYLRTAGQYLIVERKATPSLHYVQAMRRPEGNYQIEYRDGGPERHFQAYAKNRPQVVAALWGWTTRDTIWQERFEWTNIGSMFLDPQARTPIDE
ncbi:hypothetical protein VSH64_29750 [Amycolatopsis rhabdoformis]|uniref:Uncharacterized protein n=1 Tax=Amycolatopsis rhabdoformis TaxID=1448059 RepID=A0ABZ1HZS8_9PSEU|nr:hypothetical protein [Amycolatopsis rhabdoformis]WSE27041.1 hypothetical protein VSH64_29750 [Amycolatopsis rhabdoformis]